MRSSTRALYNPLARLAETCQLPSRELSSNQHLVDTALSNTGLVLPLGWLPADVMAVITAEPCNRQAAVEELSNGEAVLADVAGAAA
jgi:hypothetical protein